MAAMFNILVVHVTMCVCVCAQEGLTGLKRAVHFYRPINKQATTELHSCQPCNGTTKSASEAAHIFIGQTNGVWRKNPNS